jgi:6-phosphofructokinase 1
MRVVGFLNGFRGLVQNQTRELDGEVLSGILTDGGTILGTSRDKPHRMVIDGKTRNMIDACVETYKRHRLDALVCIGGGGTQKNAWRLMRAGLRVVTLPKTIDNDIVATDVSFGFHTALGIATEAVDRLHSTAMSHGRIIVVEVMGHRAGWLALGAGLAGGADVILIPEIPYDPDKVARAIRKRARTGRSFSIVVVAEGAMSVSQAKAVRKLLAAKENARAKDEIAKATERLNEFHRRHVNHTVELTETLEELCDLESRLSILGHLQRGGTPCAADRVLATRLGTACAELLYAGQHGVMVAAQGDSIVPVPLVEVAGRKKLVPPDHPLIRSARLVGTSFGD